MFKGPIDRYWKNLKLKLKYLEGFECGKMVEERTCFIVGELFGNGKHDDGRSANARDGAPDVN
jgi:hypothetical protein